MDKETAAMFRDFLRIGKVSSVELRTARVEFLDTTGSNGKSMISGKLQILQHKTHKDKEYWMPDVGELVLCIFLGNGAEAGFILGAVFNERDSVPENCEGKRVIEFEDKTRFEYDRTAHKLDIKVNGDTSVHIAKSEESEANLNLTIDGKSDITLNNDVNLHVAKKEDIGGNLTAVIDGDSDITTKGDIKILIAKTDNDRELELSLEGNANISVSGNVDLSVEKDKTTKISGSEYIEITGDINLECKGNANVIASQVNIDSGDVNLGTNASMKVIHEKSPCPAYGIFHLSPSSTTKTAV
jgi:phage baseplate assembly protein V